MNLYNQIIAIFTCCLLITGCSSNALKNSAEKGDPVAQYQLGFNYQTGIGVPRDLEQARYWYELSAKNGNTAARNNLIDFGKNLKQDSSSISGQQQRSGLWHYCNNPVGYFPYIKECPGGWTQVMPHQVIPNNNYHQQPEEQKKSQAQLKIEKEQAIKKAENELQQTLTTYEKQMEELNVMMELHHALQKYCKVDNPGLENIIVSKGNPVSLVKANFTSNGAPMTVTGQLKDNRIICVETSDFPGKCRPHLR